MHESHLLPLQLGSAVTINCGGFCFIFLNLAFQLADVFLGILLRTETVILTTGRFRHAFDLVLLSFLSKDKQQKAFIY